MPPIRIAALLLSILIHAGVLVSIRISQPPSFPAKAPIVIALNPFRPERQAPEQSAPQAAPAKAVSQPLEARRGTGSAPPLPEPTPSPTPTGLPTLSPTKPIPIPPISTPALAQAPATPAETLPVFSIGENEQRSTAVPENTQENGALPISNTLSESIPTAGQSRQEPGETSLDESVLMTSGAEDSDALRAYRQTIYDRLQSSRRYPREARRRKLEGSVILIFIIGQDGSLDSVRIERGSGHAILDQATLDLVRKAFPMPPPPVETGEFRMTFRYSTQE